MSTKQNDLHAEQQKAGGMKEPKLDPIVQSMANDIYIELTAKRFTTSRELENICGKHLRASLASSQELIRELVRTIKITQEAFKRYPIGGQTDQVMSEAKAIEAMRNALALAKEAGF